MLLAEVPQVARSGEAAHVGNLLKGHVRVRQQGGYVRFPLFRQPAVRSGVQLLLETPSQRIDRHIDTCPADRTELLADYKKKYEIMSEFAPKMLSAEEVAAILNEKFADVLATKNKGQIMKAVMGELKGKADGKVINQVVAELTK